MEMTITAHRTIELKAIICPECNVPANGQLEPGGKCFHCRRVDRDRKTADALAAVEALPGKIATYAVLIIGIIAVVIAIYLGGGERPPVN